MRNRRWFVLVLCAGAFACLLAGAARAGGAPVDAGQAPDAKAAPAEVEGTDGMRVVDELPKMLKQVAPRYPAGARKRGEQGTVHVRALVKKDGMPTRVQVPSGKGVTPELDRAAIEAVRQWTFVPAQSEGKPVAVYVVIPVKFQLK